MRVYVYVCHCVRVFVQAVDSLTAVFGVVVAVVGAISTSDHNKLVWTV